MKVRFGVQLWLEEFDLKGLREAWCELERMGFDSAWIYDHFYPMSKDTSLYIPEAWTVLPYLADATDRLRLGVLVTCNSYRPPPILAKIAATVDVISGGRLEFGIGAGWHKIEYDAYGIPFPTARVRLEQLSEAVDLIKKIWIQDKVSFKGKYYSVRDLVSYPKPLQKPYPPMMIGGKSNKLLRIAAEHADNINLVNCTPEEYESRLNTFAKYCSEAGRDYGSITKSYHCNVIIGDKDEIKEKVMRFRYESCIPEIQSKSLDDLFKIMIVGTPQECINKIQDYVSRGMNYFIPHFPYPEDLKPQKAFMKEIVPSF
ncbi:LLM class flavin-dependent oxidoreductase [Candidatus Bathyarchaeota archaeon]|nr:LLM class flavin-dependent oxidoreductase [Candidatus Bathyarchaeota archaeon]MBS7628406.1 LLM class flavin-dependent oxidoreductase [Candidatus Bathyarchaeota archaeon]